MKRTKRDLLPITSKKKGFTETTWLITQRTAWASGIVDPFVTETPNTTYATSIKYMTQFSGLLTSSDECTLAPSRFACREPTARRECRSHMQSYCFPSTARDQQVVPVLTCERSAQSRNRARVRRSTGCEVRAIVRVTLSIEAGSQLLATVGGIRRNGPRL
jgi:hypothetical protein